MTVTGAAAEGPELDPAITLEHLRGPGYPPGFYGTIRQRLPIFAAVGALSVLAALIPFPHERTAEILVAGALFFVLTAAAVVLPWRRLPEWFWPVIPIGYIAVIALLRDAEGGTISGLEALYFLPIVWLAFYGRREQLIVGLVAVFLAMVIPILVVGPPEYPASEWRLVVVTTIVLSLVSFSFLTMVTRDRDYVADMAEQSLLARQNARQALETREQLASLLRAATGTAVIGADENGLVSFFSAGAQRMFGYSAEEVVGTLVIDRRELFERQEDLEALVRRAHNQTTPAEEPIWTYVRKDRVKRRCSVAITSQRTVSGHRGYVIVAHDVTEREQLDVERERLLAVQREVTQVLVEQNHRLRELTQMKDDVVATVSHELRTPLTSIRGFVELLLDGKSEGFDPEQIRMLKTIDRSSRQLLQVAEDLLADPGGGQGLRVKFAATNLSTLARDAVDTMAATAASRDIGLRLVVDRPVIILGDNSRLHQLFANLLSNALKFTPPGGRVEVQVSALDHFARLDVLDTGPGIPTDQREQLFERFYRLASSTSQGVPGTGLGLAIAKSVVEAHEGTIQIVDTPGWATTFRVHLPLAQRPVVPPPPPGAAGPAPAPPGTPAHTSS